MSGGCALGGSLSGAPRQGDRILKHGERITRKQRFPAGGAVALLGLALVAVPPADAGGPRRKIELKVREGSVWAEYKARLASRMPDAGIRKFKVEVEGRDPAGGLVFHVDRDGDGVPECSFEMAARGGDDRHEAKLVFRGRGGNRGHRRPISDLGGCDPRGAMLSIGDGAGGVTVSAHLFPETPGASAGHDGDHDGAMGGGQGNGDHGGDHGMGREEMEIDLARTGRLSTGRGHAEHAAKKDRKVLEVEIREVPERGPWFLWTCDPGEAGEACAARGELRMKRKHGTWNGRAKYRTPPRGGMPALVEDPHGRRVEVRDAAGTVGFAGEFPAN